MTAVEQPAPETRSVGICSRCQTAVILTPGRGATCACGSMSIPDHFFQVRGVTQCAT